MLIYLVVVMLLVGLAFGLGYLTGLKSYNNLNNKVEFNRVEKSEHILTDKVDTNIAQEPTPGPAPTTESAVLKSPTPQEIRKRKEDQQMAEFLKHQETNKRDSGSFAL